MAGGCAQPSQEADRCMWVQHHLVGVTEAEWESSFACSTAEGMSSSLSEKEAALAVTAEDALQEGFDPQRARGTGKERSLHRSGDSSRDIAEDPASARASPVANTWQM